MQKSKSSSRHPVLIASPSEGPPALILYGLPHSLYTGIVRAYLRHQQMPFVELPPGHERFQARVLPVVQRGIIPVIETPDGVIIQDSLDIIDYLEASGVPRPAYPAGAVQRVLAQLVHLYGVQCMLRHAMHFRWSYLEEQQRFLQDAFSAGATPAVADKIMSRMHGYLPALGVVPDTLSLIEASFDSLLDILEAHFHHHPYLLGGHACIADYGLIGPLFAHLGRDPVPSDRMKRRAPKVYRWVERMMAPGVDAPEFAGYPAQLIPDDEIPTTWTSLLSHMAEEMLPEIPDKLEFMKSHVLATYPAHDQPVSEKPQRRHIGSVDTSFRGVPIAASVDPYLMYLLDKIQSATNAAEDSGEEVKRRLRHWLNSVGLEAVLPGVLDFGVGRKHQLEVWIRPSVSSC